MTGEDLGADRETRPAKPCCARLAHGWCARDENHDGNCYGPVRETAPTPSTELFTPKKKG